MRIPFVNIGVVSSEVIIVRRSSLPVAMVGAAAISMTDEALAKPIDSQGGTGILPVFRGGTAHATKGFARASDYPDYFFTSSLLSFASFRVFRGLFSGFFRGLFSLFFRLPLAACRHLPWPAAGGPLLLP
jgi:hypothetical protein